MRKEALKTTVLDTLRIEDKEESRTSWAASFFESLTESEIDIIFDVISKEIAINEINRQYATKYHKLQGYGRQDMLLNIVENDQFSTLSQEGQFYLIVLFIALQECQQVLASIPIEHELYLNCNELLDTKDVKEYLSERHFFESEEALENHKAYLLSRMDIEKVKTLSKEAVEQLNNLEISISDIPNFSKFITGFSEVNRLDKTSLEFYVLVGGLLAKFMKGVSTGMYLTYLQGAIKKINKVNSPIDAELDKILKLLQ